VGNRSSGKMGYSLAREARDRGAHVILITGSATLPPPYGVELHRVETAIQMRDAVLRFIIAADVLIMSAAVADFRPAQVAAQKIKKTGGQAETQEKSEHGNDEGLTLHMVRNPDILQEVAEVVDKAPQHQRLVRVGFAAETENLIAYAQQKLVQKHLDLLVANDVSRSDSGFGSDTNKVFIFHANGSTEDLPVMPKTDVAAAIFQRIVPLLGTT
jgi:phosphopantothenoylcysteine decarboxylase / phosphopantothenate---cysteine ligase